MAKDKMKKKKNEEVIATPTQLFTGDENPNAALVGQNILAGMPKKHTIVAALTKDEVNNMKRLSDMLDAISDSKDASYEFTLETRQEWREVWSALMEKYNIAPTWQLRIDFYSGTIYISE